MGKFNEYTQKATPEDADSLMIYDAAAKANKLSPFSGIWNWIVGKLTNAVISNLQTNNKSVVGALNELNRIYGDSGHSVSISSDINAIFNAMDDESISIRRYGNESANKPEYSSGIIITFKDVLSYGWNIAVCNGKVYSRNIDEGIYGNWTLLS